MTHKVLSTLVLLLWLPALQAQDLSLFEKHYYVQAGDTLPYRLLLPEGYSPKTKYPLVLFLHGAGERGSDNEKQLVHGARLFVRPDVRRDYPAIVVFPQCPQESYWSQVRRGQGEDGKHTFDFPAEGAPTAAMGLLEGLLAQLLRDYPIQKDRVYVGGLSMGGMGTFELVARHPKVFAAAFPICGGANPELARRMRRPAWWIFHGAKDDVVPPVLSQQMAGALQKAGARVRFTLYPEANHNSWDPAFAEPDLLAWLFSQRR